MITALVSFLWDKCGFPEKESAKFIFCLIGLFSIIHAMMADYLIVMLLIRRAL